jgi:gluconolactonase
MGIGLLTRRQTRYTTVVMFPAILVTLMAAHAFPDTDIVAPGATLQKLGDGYSFTEGPAADAQGNIFFTDQPNDSIIRWSNTGRLGVWMKPSGRSNGMRFDSNGNLIACADDKNQLWSISPSKKVTVLVKNYNGKLLNGPNDVWIRPDGALYFTDPLYVRPYWTRPPDMQQPGQYVYFLSADRQKLFPVATDLVQPNGIVGTPDGVTLYVADIGGNKTYKYRIHKDGTLSNKTLFCPLGSDGMTMDTEGNVYLTGQGVTVFNRAGKQIKHIDVPEGWTGNVRFGGKDRKLLFITASKSVYGLKMRVTGVL